MSHQVISDFCNLHIDDHIKVIALDFDNTCYQYEPCHQYAIAAVKSVFEEKYGTNTNFDILYKDAQTEVKKRIPTHGASHVRLLYFQALLHAIDSSDIVQDSLAFETLYWEQFMEKMKPVKGLFDFLAECQRNGTTVVVISDLTARTQFKKMVALGVANFINFVVTSEESGVEKPDAKMFRLVMEKTKSTANDVLVIGDSLEKDIMGAHALGLKAIQITHEELPQNTPVRQSRDS